jgi:type II secretory pathway pseudopilin PulG
VELMVVVLIIGILVAIAVPVFNSASESARLRTCMGNQRTIEGSVESYRTNGQPMWVTGRTLNGNGTHDSPDNLVPTYIKAAPKCPTTKQYYWVDEHGTVTGDTSHSGFTHDHRHY